MMDHIKNCISNAKSAMDRSVFRMYRARLQAQQKLKEECGQFAVDHTVVFVIIIVIGGISMGLLTVYLKDHLAGQLEDKIDDFFN